jgi:hypothetical protein
MLHRPLAAPQRAWKSFAAARDPSNGFANKVFALRQAPQVLDQYPTIDQKRAGGLVAAEAMQQLDRTAAMQSEQVLDHGAVHHGHIE